MLLLSLTYSIYTLVLFTTLHIIQLRVCGRGGFKTSQIFKQDNAIKTLI